MDVRRRIELRREDILRIAAKHGARNVRVIGSVARGDFQEDSDIDLLVEFEAGRTLFDHAALIAELESFLDCKVDVASERGLRERVRTQILTEAQPL